MLDAPQILAVRRPRPADSARHASVAAERNFLRRLEAFEQLAVDLWRASPPAEADLGRRRSLGSRWLCGRRLAAHVDEVGRLLAGSGQDETEQTLRRELPRLGHEMLVLLGFGGVDSDLLMRPDMTGATEDFVRRARSEDPLLPPEDLGQALRNFWVVNLFQLLRTGTPRCTEASLAYSLLYPYTDNALDDADLSATVKTARSQRLGLRLSGVRLPASGPAEAQVFQQLDRIDDELPRLKHPELHLALQAIHRAQVASLRQQRDLPLDEDELLRCSVRKGGGSVLVDAYLVDGGPSLEMARFAFVYGVVLQLADDLQDIEIDLTAGHQTLFTRAAVCGTLGATFWRLVNFLDASLKLCPASSCGATHLATLARSSMVHLMIQAVGAQHGHFSRRLRRHMEKHNPVTFRRARRIRNRLARILNVSF